ncbi:TetR family transcriptional regulator [Ruminococcus sp. AF37-6AT]|jgi:probable dihydroxyacetone kinase regulator|nr:TetR-like C-terminal domain-containing protein [uncultured Blautia sp.]MBS6711047.1 TetR family transcriptional regulator C-terminal domain-containing protein [Ruminococcus sp.]RGI62915.1 TetR family transcriptional regulator [Ruminococcus sp. TM10-9AT]RGW21821.1 TetR family transcriptional regulator [Ruminococcus sp. AF13-37]RGW21952.1 TetR family transcriptional regulator [Ruminococcus sp. AF13-28]RHD90592.1 TetR family transcriptional regulator [Ruminococcus sp. AM30-15AC]RHJ98956.1 Tet
MPNATKAALEESLKRLLLKKPLDKITITDITTDCGISRMAFYYHFKDIYDLVEWSCVEDGTKALQGKKTYDSWTEGLTQIFEAVLENKPFIMNVYRNVDRERMERYLYHLTYDLIVGVVQEKSKDLDISGEDKKFIANFYKYGFVGIMLEWIQEGMKEDIEELVNKMSLTLHNTVTTSIRNFQKNSEECYSEIG